tara:strand:- start:2318 stop:3262 length:945 start_codon:yes stop_codon:yes gene_type:complete
MANTSGATSFNLDLTELVEEAFERAGGELRTGYDLRTARRSLNIMFADWANRGINLWTIETGTITLVQGQNTYALPDDTIDLLEHVIRTGGNVASTQADLSITRISVSTYATIPNKIQQARPIQVWIQRYNGQTSPVAATLTTTITSTSNSIVLNDVTGLPAAGFVKIDDEIINYSYITQNTNAKSGTLNNCFRGQQNTIAVGHTAAATVYWQQVPAVTVWPTPDNAQQYQFVYWRLRRTQDAGGGVNIMDVPFRFIPCMAAGLSFYIAGKIPTGLERITMLKAQYDEAWELAAQEDHEKAALRLVPRQTYIGR